MITRAVIIKTTIFVAVALLGIGYLLTAYVGVGTMLFGGQYTAYVQLADSGGIFTTASVTYRGVEVGRVGAITLNGSGIRVALNLKSNPKIPLTNLKAVVGDGSPIGEQFIDLRPSTNTGPYLHSGSVIPEAQTSLPINSQDVLISLDKLVNSVPKAKLRDLVNELGTAFADTGPDLQHLLDAAHSLVATAQNDLPQTIGLLHSGGKVLDTQNNLSNDILAFSRHLASFTDTLRGSDKDLRRLINNGSPASTELSGLVRGIDATLPVVLNNLVSVGQVTAVRVPAIRQILIIYPYVIATSYGLFPNNGSTRFGVPVPPSTDQPPCSFGYFPKSKRRLPSVLKYAPIRYNSFCKEPTSANVNPRGSREAPEPNGKRLGDLPSYKNNAGLPGGAPGDTASTTSSAIATVTGSGVSFTGPNGRNYVLGSTGGEQRVMGDKSWTWLLFGPMA
jgi:phospholipid/cholesterol/gamma-HCH transport system substrate-binding protein